MKGEKKKEKYYVEFVPKKDNEIYCLYAMQSRGFKTAKQALTWLNNNFDYIDEELMAVYIMIEVYVGEGDYDVFSYASSDSSSPRRWHLRTRAANRSAGSRASTTS